MHNPEFFVEPDDLADNRGFYPDGLTAEAITALQRDVGRDLRAQGYPVPPEHRADVRRHPHHERASGHHQAATSPPSFTSPQPRAHATDGGTGAADDAGPSAGQLTGDPVDDATGNADQLLFTAADAADMLRVPESWLRRRAARRLVPCTFLGKHLRFSRADLDQIVTDAARPVATDQHGDSLTRPPRRRGRPRGPARPVSR
jgi:hypothetical protein